MNCARWAHCNKSKPQFSLLNFHFLASTSSDRSQFLFYFTSTSLDFQTPISSHGQSSRLLVSVYHFCCQIRSQWITQHFALKFSKSLFFVLCSSESGLSSLANEKPESNLKKITLEFSLLGLDQLQLHDNECKVIGGKNQWNDKVLQSDHLIFSECQCV